jgi:hypothetical protein
MSTSEPARSDPVARLEQHEQELDRAQERVEEHGEAELERLQDAYETFRETLEIYQDQVVGDEGDIQTIVEFQSQLDAAMKEVPKGVLLREVFEECDEYMQQKWFGDDDFEHVYEQLEPIADLVARLDDRDEALSAYRDARRRVTARARECKKEIEHLERLSELADADLDAPTDRLREPIEAYNDAVREAFAAYKREQPAREVVRFLDRMEQFPLIEYRSPPADIAEYVAEEPPGTEPIPTLLEYADYSRSKLDHYVDDPNRLKHAIEGHRAYLAAIDGGPLTVDWPPPAAGTLRYRCRELTTAVNRIDPTVVEKLRRVEALPRETDYDRLRNAAVAREDLSDEERERVRSGAIEEELGELRAEREELLAALEEYPER